MMRSFGMALLLVSSGWSESLTERLRSEVSVTAQAVSFQGKQYPLAEAAGAILPQLGWREPQNRAELALAWVKAVDLAGRASLRPAKVQTRPNGSTEVEVWLVRPKAASLPQEVPKIGPLTIARVERLRRDRVLDGANFRLELETDQAASSGRYRYTFSPAGDEKAQLLQVVNGQP